MPVLLSLSETRFLGLDASHLHASLLAASSCLCKFGSQKAWIPILCHFDFSMPFAQADLGLLDFYSKPPLAYASSDLMQALRGDGLLL